MNKLITTAAIFVLMVTSFSCKKLVPEDKDTIDPAAKFLTTTFSPVLGRNTIYRGIYSYGQSSVPLKFEIVNLRRFNGDPAPELTSDVHQVKVWKLLGGGGYTGSETTLKEIEDKRTTENHRIFEMRDYSGEILVWSGMNTSKLITRPDSGYKFDVKVSNSGAVRYYYNMRFMPYKAIPHDPHNYDLNTGMATSPAITSGRSGISVSNVTRLKDNAGMGPNEVDVYFNRVQGGNGNSLTFKFLDSAFRAIDPHLFNKTDWEHLVHGFDMKLTNTEVKYTVAYPIPLVVLPTRYTNTAGTRAHVDFSYYRIGYAGFGITANIELDFAIYEAGDWEVVFHFKNTSPKFTNDN